MNKFQPQKKAVYFDVDNYDNAVCTSEQILEQKPSITPMKQQYVAIKQYHPNNLVLMQRGNFYQAFLEDAQFIKSVLEYNWKEKDIVIGIPEQHLQDAIYKLVMLNKVVVLCQQVSDSLMWEENTIINRIVTGIYSKGMIGFGILAIDIDSNYLVSLHKGSAIVVDTIRKTAYFTTDLASQSINIAELVSNEYFQTKAIKTEARGNSSFEQLQNLFNDRKINGIDLITFYDEYQNDITATVLQQCHAHSIQQQKFCYISESAFRQLYFKSLFKTVTKDGQNMLMKFLKQPLLNDFQDRQQAIKDLSNIRVFRDSFIEQIKIYPNMRKRLGLLYGCKSSYYKLRCFIEDIKRVVTHIKVMILYHKHLFKSKILTSFKDVDYDKIEQFDRLIIWEGNDYEIPTPADGNFTISTINQLAEQEFYLVKQRDFDNNANVTYNSRFEIEIPEQLDRAGLIFSSKRKGFKRYRTQTLVEAEQKVLRAQAEVKQFIEVFWTTVVMRQFIELKSVWNHIIDQLSLLDALIGFSKYLEDDPHCYPVITEQNHMCIVNLKHPLIEDCNTNSVVIDNCIIISGDNGAGKSTLLRSVGLLVILAQTGCRLPCKSMTFRPFNSIHCRMGGYDTLQRSTFQVEMQEVKDMFDKQNALLLIDELGRGTSTVDGHALAYAVLKYLMKKQSSIILFTTHFDITLAQQYYMTNYQMHKGQKLYNLSDYIINKM